MPLTSYCKKCGQDVPVGDTCPQCGKKLPANAQRLAWCVPHHPMKDWMCWNEILRFALPALGAVAAIALVIEGIVGGLSGMMMLLSTLLLVLTGLTGLLLAVLLLLFILQGEDLLDCVVDAQGLHVTTYLPRPTKMKMLLRGVRPEFEEDTGLVFIRQRDIAWHDICRVQLWEEKNLALCYAPRYFLKLALPCTPFTWLDALAVMGEKLGKRKDIRLPEFVYGLTPSKAVAPKGKARKLPKKPKGEQQLAIEDVPLPAQSIPPEEVPESWDDADFPVPMDQPEKSGETQEGTRPCL